MTTTMESDIDLLNPTETSPQQQAQAQADPPSTTPPVVPGNTGDHHLPPDDDTDGILARAEKKQRDEELRALRFALSLLDLPPMANVRLCGQQDLRAHTGCPRF